MIEIEDLSVVHPTGMFALQKLNCAVNAGDCCALLGENGAGKSTLLQAILGLIPIKKGSIRVDGITVERKNLNQIRARVGLVFQNSDDQLFCATIRDDVAFGLKNSGMPASQAREKAEQMMAQMGIAALGDRPPQRLSDGEKKRAALAGVLAMSPSILLLDEPTAQLDPRAKRELMALLAALSCTRLIATHDLDLAKALCPSCIILKHGMLAASGRTSDLLAEESLLAECGLI